MIKFEKIRFKNFLSFGNNPTELILDRKSNTLIVGKNGAGKTTALISIVFALFGKPLKKVNKSAIVNSINKKDCLVELFFKKNNDSYIIKRGINPNIFEIWKNNELLNQSSTTIDYQKILEEEILQSSYKTFIQTVIIQSKFIPFMELNIPERRELIEDIFNVNYFSNMNIILKNKIKNNKDEITDIKYKIENNNNLLIKEKENLENIKNNNNLLIQKYQNDIENSNEKIKNLDIQITKTHDNILKLKTLNKNIDTENVNIKKINQLYTELKLKTHNIEKELNFFQTNDNCPVCSQNIENSFKNIKIEKYKNELNELNTKIEKLNNKKNDIEKTINDKNEYNNKLNEKIKILNDQYNNNLINKKSLQDYIYKLEKNIIELNKLNNNTDEKEKNINDLEENVKKLEKRYDYLNDEQKYLDTIAIMLKDNGIKSYIIKSFLPKINQLISKYMDIFGFNCSFELNEQFEETIKARYCQKYSYGNFSEGEKLRINLSILFMFRELADLRSSFKTNILFFDEALDSSLDEEGVNGFLQIINTLEKDKDVFVISHHGESFYDNFENIIRFEKNGNYSVKKIDTFIE